MLEQFRHQENFSPIDFSFVYGLDENTLNFFFEITDVAISAMVESIEEDPTYGPNLSPERSLEIQAYFRDLLELYTDYELYEECEDILFIINTLEGSSNKSEEIVGNMLEKH